MARTTAKSLLADYKRKRDFTQTKEPDDQASFASSGHRFVVQKHAARRLHYDFRLELDGLAKNEKSVRTGLKIEQIAKDRDAVHPSNRSAEAAQPKQLRKAPKKPEK